MKKTSKTNKKTPTCTNKDKFSKQKVMDAIIQSGGYKIAAAKILGCERQTLDRYIAKYPEIKKCHEEMQDSFVENLEKRAFEIAESGNVSLLMFLLRTKGKNRGYAEAKPLPVGTTVSDEVRIVLGDLLDGKITASEAALRIEMTGAPVPDSVRILMSKEVVVESDPTNGEYSVISPEEMARRFAERSAEVESQKKDFLPTRQEEVADLKRILGPRVDTFVLGKQGDDDA